MTMLGLSPLYVAGIVVAGIALTILLYLRQWGRRRVVVAFTPLWKRVLSEADIGTSRRRVLELMSMLLQLAVIVLLALALGRPLVGRKPGVHAIVLDTSASMLAKRPPRGDRMAAAKQRALELLDRLSDDDRVALVTTGGEARLQFAPTRDHYALRRRITSVEACACEGRLREALEIARGVVPDPEAIHVLTDGNEATDEAEGGQVELFGSAASNIGITLLGVRPAAASPGRYEGALEIASFAQGRARAQLRMSVDGQLLDLRDVRLQPGERQRLNLPPLVAARGENLLKVELFNIEIEGDVDALAEDDRAFALLAAESERPVRLLAPPTGAQFVREALRANPRYRLIEEDPSKASTTAVAGAITVVAGVPTPQAPGRYLVLAPKGGKTSPLDDGLFSDWRNDHPLLRQVALQGIEIKKASTVVPPAGAQVLGRFADVPLLYLRESTDRVEIGTTFDVEDSNLPLRVAFPVLVYSAIDWLAGASDADGEKLLGRRWRIERLASGPIGRLSVTGPSKNVEASQRGDTLVVDNANAPGLYRITADDETFRIAASLTSMHESDLGVKSAPAKKGAPLGRAADLWSWLLYAALGVLGLEWLLYHRRVTS